MKALKLRYNKLTMQLTAGLVRALSYSVNFQNRAWRSQTFFHYSNVTSRYMFFISIIRVAPGAA